MEQDQVTYQLPTRFGFENGPRTDSISWPQRAVLNISTSPSTDKVEVLRKLVYGYTILGPADYGALRDFYRKIAEADQQQLILTRSAGATRN